MEYLYTALGVLALLHLVMAFYYEMFKGDDIKVMKHEVSAVLMIALIIWGNVT